MCRGMFRRILKSDSWHSCKLHCDRTLEHALIDTTPIHRQTFVKSLIEGTPCHSLVVLCSEMSQKTKVPIMEKELNSCLVIFELSGLQYFSLKSLTPENVKSRLSWVRFMYMLVLLVTLTGLVLATIYIQEEEESDKSITTINLLGFIVKQSMNAGLMLVTVTTLIESYTSTQNMKQLYLNQKEIIRTYSQHFDVIIDFKKLKKMATRRGLVLTTFYLGVNGILTYINIESEKYFLLSTIGLVPVLFLFMSVLKFVFYVSSVNEQLTFLMNYLEEIFKHDTISLIDDMNHRMIQLKPRPPKPSDDHIRKLRSAVRIYGIIYENSGLINASVGWSVLSFLLCLTTATTVSMYQLFVILVGGLPIDHLPSE